MKASHITYACALTTNPINTSLSVQEVHFFRLSNNFSFLSTSKTDFKCYNHPSFLYILGYHQNKQQQTC